MRQPLQPQQPHSEHKFEVETKENTPIFTFMMIMAVIWVYCAPVMTGATRRDVWLVNNTYSADKVMEWIVGQHWDRIAGMIFNTNFAPFNEVHMGLSAYFIFVFGAHVEKKLGAGRYIPLIVLGLTAPWAVLYMSVKDTTHYLGPFFLLCTIIGCYMIFPPTPKSKYLSESRREKGQIFRKDPREDPLSKYVANPWMFISSFVGCQIALHLWITIGFGPFKPMPGYDVIALIPAVAAVGIGYGLGWFLIQDATANVKGGATVMEALRKYYELMDLDVGHEEALKGTARSLGISYDKVRDWVQKNKGKMRVK